MSNPPAKPKRKKRKPSKANDPHIPMTICDVGPMYDWELQFAFSGYNPKWN